MKRLLATVYFTITLSIVIWLIAGLIFSPSATYGKHLLGITLIGLVIGLGADSYNHTKKYIVATICHITSSVLIFLGVASWLKWFPMKAEIIIFSIGLFFLIFFVIWTGFYLWHRKKIAEINQRLK